jgi:hypothetical protein
MDLNPKYAKLDTYLDKWGVIRRDFLSDPRRPLVFKIGTTEYVLREEAALFESQIRAAAHYARAGIPEHRMPVGPAFRPEALLESEGDTDEHAA